MAVADFCRMDSEAPRTSFSAAEAPDFYNMWAYTSLDAAWAYVGPHHRGFAPPLLLAPGGQPLAHDLARHWCPGLYDGSFSADGRI